MKYTLSMAALLILGGCNADHSIGQIDQDAGPHSANLDAFTASVDSVANPQVYPDALGASAVEAGGIVQTPPTGGVDAGSIGTAGASQSWTGYIENSQFPSGSDAVRFTFSVDSSGQVTGKVIFGNGTPPPPVTDPNVGYPSNFQDLQPSLLLEGFPYSMTTGSYSPDRIRFTIQINELWREWCALQIPIDDSGMCLPAWDGTVLATPGWGQCSQSNPTTGETVIIDCERFHLCQGPFCTCSSTACRVNESDSDAMSFDLAISGATASGSSSGRGSSRYFHFTKAP